MKHFLALAAALLVGVSATPALALTAEQAACPAARLPADFNAGLDRTLSARGDKADFEATRTAIGAAVKACVAEMTIDPAEVKRLASYTLGLAGSNRARELLDQRRIPAAVIDRVLDIGAAGSNPQRSNLADEDWTRLNAALAESGFDAATLSDDDKRLIDGYAALTTLYWLAKRAFGL